MQFSSHEERENYFNRIEDDPLSVLFGAAMEHASTFRLGLFGDRNALKTDCAKIMSAELRRYCLENDLSRAAKFITSSSILGQSNAFHQAFEAARLPVESEMHNQLGEIIVQMHGLDASPAWRERRRDRLNEKEAESLQDLHEKILDDLRTSQVIACLSSRLE